MWLRARAGPLRDRLTAALALPLPARRIAPTVSDEALFGGLDLAATLATGRSVTGAGLLSSPAAITLAMAERCPPGLAARLALALDTGAHCLVALDESAEEGETLPPALGDRLALFVDLDGLPQSDCPPVPPADTTAARARLPDIATPDAAIAILTRTAAALGIPSLRAPALALAAARAHAALRGGDRVTDTDLLRASELVLAHRATQIPETDDAPRPPEQPPEAPDDAPPPDPQPQTDRQTAAEDLLIEAAKAALPADLLARLAAGRALRSAKGSGGTGAAKKGNRRGRPLPSRPGKPGAGARIDLVATLRNAAPWQPMRRAQTPTAPGLLIRPSDIRIKRYQETSDRVLIFVVDASGSAAFARLGEAKGAVELLLAQAYARRDHVALIAFRGTTAELLLPPTRSLVQTKRRLAALPGGGGTPLAAGLQTALQVATKTRARGMTPTIALLTDGRGNVALDGTASRPQAEADAARMARALANSTTPALVIDTAIRPQQPLRALATLMRAPCIALPRADAARLSAALAGALDGTR